LLEKQFRRRGYRCEPITLGGNTDPYQPIEREYQITRSLLEVFDRYQHPLTIVTKSNLVLRDLDLLSHLASQQLVHVYLSVTTLDRTLARRMEPRAATPERRLAAIRALNEAKVPVGVLAAPMIPGLNDHELEKIMEHGKAAGAQVIGYVLLRLPHELKDLFVGWLEEHYPDRRGRIENLIRQCRDGRLNQTEFGERMRGTGPYAELLAKRFAVAKRKLNFGKALPPHDTTRFKIPEDPERTDDMSPQLSLFPSNGIARKSDLTA
jgi:DNA repair photolyase